MNAYIKMRPLRDVLWEAQGGRCWICEGRMVQTAQYHAHKATLDHVFPRAKFRAAGDIGITLLAHSSCNSHRHDPWPTDDEIRKLIAIWRRVDPDWLRISHEDTERQGRALTATLARAEILSLYRQQEAA